MCFAAGEAGPPNLGFTLQRYHLQTSLRSTAFARTQCTAKTWSKRSLTVVQVTEQSAQRQGWSIDSVDMKGRGQVLPRRAPRCRRLQPSALGVVNQKYSACRIISTFRCVLLACRSVLYAYVRVRTRSISQAPLSACPEGRLRQEGFSRLSFLQVSYRDPSLAVEARRLHKARVRETARAPGLQ